jgi:multidrug efflux pump subunit AcrA (membrane-fusion protein)
MLVIVLAGAGGWWLLGSDKPADGAGPLFHTVAVAPFVHEVTELGGVESSNNVEVRCLVESKNQSGTMIRWIIAEGTDVKSGDKLVELDDSALQDELVQQQIMVNNSTALVTQAENALRTAETALREYTEGTYLQEVETIQAEIAQAEEDLRRAKQYLQYSKRLAAKGHITPLQLKADQFAVTKAQNGYNAAMTKLHVLQEFTRKKMVDTLEADVETARVKLDSEQKSHGLDVRKLEKIEDQIAKCTIVAPCDGQVVYANEADWRGQNQIVIQEGTAIRQQQTIIRLPDPEQMQVKAKVNESRIDLIHPGMRVTVKLDAFPDVPLQGVVTKVDAYPLPTSGWMSNIKEYGTYVALEKAPASVQVRAGLTAQVKIHVEYQPEALQVPVATIKEINGHHFVLVREGERLRPQEVELGSTNDKSVVILSGLEAGAQIVFNPGKYTDQVEMPDVAPPEPKAEQFAKDESAATRARPQRRGEDSASAGGGEGAAPPRAGSFGGGDPAQIVAGILQRYDTDGNGRISSAEIDAQPEDRRERMRANDTNGDGEVDREELSAAMSRFSGGGPPRGAAESGPPSASTGSAAGGSAQ